MKVPRNLPLKEFIEWMPFNNKIPYSRIKAVEYLSKWQSATEKKMNFMHPEYKMKSYEWIDNPDMNDIGVPEETEKSSIIAMKILFEAKK